VSRRAIEDALTAEGDRARRRLCAIAGIEPSHWRRVSWIRIAVEVDAMETTATRIQSETGCGYEPAVREASRLLGVDPETHRKRLDRARADAYDPSNEPADILSLPNLTPSTPW
jgi:hypothetical protein